MKIVDNHKTSAKLFNAEMMRRGGEHTTWTPERKYIASIYEWVEAQNIAINMTLA